MFKLTDIQIIIFRRVINDSSDDFYEKSLRLIKFLIKKLQTKDQWIKKFHVKKFVLFRRLRKRFKKWVINDESLIKHNEYFYVLNDAIVKEKIIKKHHDDSLSKHFET